MGVTGAVPGGAGGSGCEIRRLGPGQVADLKALGAVFADAFFDADAPAEPPPDAHLERLLARDHVIVMTAVLDGAVVGGLTAYELEKIDRERSEIFLYDLAVDERHRRKGVATALIRRLEGVAAERGADVVFVQAHREDEPAIALYTRLGRREDVLHFDIPVSRGRS